jgi:hypothetical protein
VGGKDGFVKAAIEKKTSAQFLNSAQQHNHLSCWVLNVSPAPLGLAGPKPIIILQSRQINRYLGVLVVKNYCEAKIYQDPPVPQFIPSTLP